MSITFRNYIGDRSEKGDYVKVHRFLAKNGFSDYTYGRFDWMMTNWEYLEDQYLNRIGIWEENGEIVGVTLFDHSMDDIFPLVKPGCEDLYGEMIEYAEKNMIRETEPDFRVYANDNNAELIKVLEQRGIRKADGQEHVAVFDFSVKLPESSLPEGYSFTTLLDEADFEKGSYCTFKGFNHELEGETFSYDIEKDRNLRAAFLNRNHLDLGLRIFVKNAEGDYVAHCGMWYDPEAGFALIEPVCVVPECRRMGLGREVVREGLRRVSALGAKKAVVGSDQQFYYAIGMKPYTTGTMWKSERS